jgi:hypothetical protein
VRGQQWRRWREVGIVAVGFVMALGFSWGFCTLVEHPHDAANRWVVCAGFATVVATAVDLVVHREMHTLSSPEAADLAGPALGVSLVNHPPRGEPKAAAKGVVEIRTVLTLEQVKHIFSSTLLQFSEKKVVFGTNPFREAHEADFQGYAALKTLTGGWTVEIYITDHQDVRIVDLLPVGSTGLERAVFGLKNTYSLADSGKQAAAVINGMRAADPTLQFA